MQQYDPILLIIITSLFSLFVNVISEYAKVRIQESQKKVGTP
jgi:hypothetical protein